MSLPATQEVKSVLSLEELDNLPPALADAFANGSPMQQMLGLVLNELGGTDAIVDWAEENMSDFMRLIMAANPAPVQATGSSGGTHLHIHPALAAGPLDIQGEVVSPPKVREVVSAES